MRLRALFDNNRSTLLINGRSSQPVAYLRGLLQGSSLSPLLFNLFINSMLVRIKRHPMVTGSLPTNCLAFADDVVLFSLTHHGMQALLDCCQNWAEAVGMKFAPEKCVVLGANTHLTCRRWNRRRIWAFPSTAKGWILLRTLSNELPRGGP
jgi:Reverse transcriptase (RNA-dependent DNA polymerase)